MRTNPYTPGAGFVPAYLAGRENLIQNAETYLSSIHKRYPQQSVIYYGLTGVGKTALLNTIETSADNLGILYAHIEAGENKRFIVRLVGSINRFIREISLKEAAKDFAKRCGSLVKSFMVTYNIEEKTVGVGMQQEENLSTGIFAEDLKEIFVTLGKAALKSDDTICIFIDEVQYLTEEEISGLIIAVHRCNQLGLPIMLFCAGLPKILKTVGEACSYAERLFKFEIVDALTNEEAEAAIVNPANDLGVSYMKDAVDHIVRVTDGYPYFIQEYCSVIWNRPFQDNRIQDEDVNNAESLFLKTLDTGFFAVRYNRCTNLEKAFMIAMVKCGDLPCSISNVSKNLKREVRAISPIRDQLISKDKIYPIGHAEIDFTIPQFNNFIKRINPELEI